MRACCVGHYEANDRNKGGHLLTPDAVRGEGGRVRRATASKVIVLFLERWTDKRFFFFLSRTLQSISSRSVGRKKTKNASRSLTSCFTTLQFDGSDHAVVICHSSKPWKQYLA